MGNPPTYIAMQDYNYYRILFMADCVWENMHIYILYWLCFNSLQALDAPSQVTSVSLAKSLRLGRPCLIVIWTAPQSDATISRYEIQYRRSGEASWGSEAAITGLPPPTSFVLVSLDAGTIYIVRLRAESDVGTGVWSAEQNMQSEFLCIIRGISETPFVARILLLIIKVLCTWE